MFIQCPYKEERCITNCALYNTGDTIINHCVDAYCGGLKIGKIVLTDVEIQEMRLKEGDVNGDS